MKMIPNIKLKDKELSELLYRNKFYDGSEACIYRSNNPHTLYKIFWNYHKKIPMSDNKVAKINLLYHMNLEHCVKPVSTISYKDMIIGYEMTTDIGLQRYNLCQLNRDELLYFLNTTKNILEYFTSKEIIYGDVAERNILFNKNTLDIKFCDMDNIQIDKYNMDIVPNQLLEYESIRGMDCGVHPYMHNIMTMGAYQLYLRWPTKSSIEKNFYYRGRKIIYSMEEPNNFKNEYLIKYKKKNK